MATAIEYGLIATAIVASAITAMSAIGHTVFTPPTEPVQWVLKRAEYKTAGDCYSDAVNVPGAYCEMRK